MVYNTISFLLHKACTAACDSCCVGSHPGCNERLNTERVKEYIKSAGEELAIKGVGFTGGEPFLYYESLKDLISFTYGEGKAVTAATNGYWADTYDIAYEKLQELKKKGLSQIGISYDYFHADYVDAQNIKNILLAANDLELPSTLNAVMTSHQPIGSILDSLGGSIKETQLMILPCQPVGNAKIFLKEEDYIRTRKSKGCYCKKSGTYTVRYDGTIWPCCSPSVFNTELQIGNYENLEVSSTLEKLRNHRILYLLRNFGFDYFINIAEEELGIPVPEYVVSACELCSIFFCSENIHKFYPFVFETINELALKRKGKETAESKK